MSTSDDFIPYARQSINEQDIQAMGQALQGTAITRGPHVEAFEKAIADYCGARYAVAFNSGTTALIAACHAAEVGPHDRLLTSPNTFIATAGAGICHQATPVFIDIDRNTGNIDLDLLDFNINRPSSRGRTVVSPVHFAGIPVDMELLDNLIKNPDTVVIEDAAHALGSTYKDGQKVGCCAWSQMTMFSLHPAKTITTGEGGIITTNDPELDHKLRLFRNNGIEREPPYLLGTPAPWYYEVHDITNNTNFTEFQAALGISQLSRIDSFIEKRRELVRAYREKLKDIPSIRLFTDELDAFAAFHLFVVQIDFESCGTTRQKVMETLKAKGIGTQVHYIPLYRHPVIAKNCGDISEYFPQMEAYYAQALSLPLYYDLPIEKIDYIVSSLKEALNQRK